MMIQLFRQNANIQKVPPHRLYAALPRLETSTQILDLSTPAQPTSGHEALPSSHDSDSGSHFLPSNNPRDYSERERVRERDTERVSSQASTVPGTFSLSFFQTEPGPIQFQKAHNPHTFSKSQSVSSPGGLQGHKRVKQDALRSLMGKQMFTEKDRNEKEREGVSDSKTLPLLLDLCFHLRPGED